MSEETQATAGAPTEHTSQPMSKWDDAQFRAVTRERDEAKKARREAEERAAALEAQAAKVQADLRRRSLEWDVLSEVPTDKREAARHLLLGVAVDKGLDFGRDIDADTVATMRTYVSSQFAGISTPAPSPAPAPRPAPQAPPVAESAPPMFDPAKADWSKQTSLDGLTNDQRMAFAKANPDGYFSALKKRKG